ncbi:hypothetical protein Sgly_2561 [Syntrophobotulus glycolicus DSM 8271]|uniref:Uncharacterized protein n=1 Tax=Syntrophobotulus glycolicus (strain DSM 8271 / FlGlyR) TaxID=645991 RepID=F0SWK3_SYNGF|nr:hypothetical protein Sgly_2561 [Syntrophobotulus glycolicus DSM 8271]
MNAVDQSDSKEETKNLKKEDPEFEKLTAQLKLNII